MDFQHVLLMSYLTSSFMNSFDNDLVKILKFTYIVFSKGLWSY